jgi:two-component system, NtrC family, sensor histidine kinase KinB
MSLKTKLIWGLAFLFLIIFGLIGVCSYYVGRLGHESDNILKDNYDSIVYSRNMLAGLDDMKTSTTSTVYDVHRGKSMSDYYVRLFDSGRKLFETNLKAENGNITEPHEKEHVDKLNQEYESYLRLSLQMRSVSREGGVSFDSFLSATERLKELINAIYDINIQAVVHKSRLTSRDSSSFASSMAIIGSICLLLALGYFWYFPLYVSTTLSYLSERLRNLLRRSGVIFDTKTKDEAFVMLQAIDLLEKKLGTKGSDNSEKV